MCELDDGKCQFSSHWRNFMRYQFMANTLTIDSNHRVVYIVRRFRNCYTRAPECLVVCLFLRIQKVFFSSSKFCWRAKIIPIDGKNRFDVCPVYEAKQKFRNKLILFMGQCQWRRKPRRLGKKSIRYEQFFGDLCELWFEQKFYSHS